jgi:phosphate starvation-inducible protein PhoH
MAKRARKTKKQQHQSSNYSDDVISVSAYRRRQKHVQIIPKNLLQEDYLEMLDDANKAIVFAMGPAGTGKTMLGVLAAIDAMNNAIKLLLHDQLYQLMNSMVSYLER